MMVQDIIKKAIAKYNDHHNHALFLDTHHTNFDNFDMPTQAVISIETRLYSQFLPRLKKFCIKNNISLFEDHDNGELDYCTFLIADKKNNWKKIV